MILIYNLESRGKKIILAHKYPNDQSWGYLLRGLNQGFWSHLGCFRRNAKIVNFQSISWGALEEIITSSSTLDFRCSLESALLARAPFPEQRLIVEPIEIK